jgi:hypothetical protein
MQSPKTAPLDLNNYHTEADTASQRTSRLLQGIEIWPSSLDPTVRFRVPAQVIDATQALNLSAGVWNPKV